MATKVKSERRVTRATELAATRPRDPVTKKWLKATPKADPSPAASTSPGPAASVAPPAGGDAPASAPFRGRLRARLRQKSGS